jgi:uncharacterized protein (TIGR02001 family)
LHETPIPTPRSKPGSALLCALALVCAMPAADARAQVAGSLAIVSDYRFRGVSLSRENPAIQASVGFDAANGWYAGVFGSSIELADRGTRGVQAVPYVGVAAPVAGDLHWEAGADYSTFSSGRAYDYGEVYAGITFRKLNVRVHYSPEYFGLAHASLYGEMNASQPLRDGVALLAHVGVLAPLSSAPDPYTVTIRNPVDVRAGMGIDVAALNIQLAWIWTDGVGSAYPAYQTQQRNAFVASLSWSY